jgi:ribonuclease HI
MQESICFKDPCLRRDDVLKSVSLLGISFMYNSRMIIPEKTLICFTDGASSGNPGPGGWGAIIVNPVRDEVSELGGGKPRTTNNEMELSAVVAVLASLVANELPAMIVTDSSYVLKGATLWAKNWQARGWTTAAGDPVANRELWETLVSLLAARQAPLSWALVKGHVGIPGNERADVIATANAKGVNETLYRGRLDEYPIKNILEIPDAATQSAARKASSKSTPAHSYVALVDGNVSYFKTWAECESAVKGKSGAKFKKSTSPENEAEIIAGWGVDPDA